MRSRRCHCRLRTGMLGHDIGTGCCGKMATSPRNVWSLRNNVLREEEIEVLSTTTCMKFVMNLPSERVFCPSLQTIASASFFQEHIPAHDPFCLRARLFQHPVCRYRLPTRLLSFFHIPDVHIQSHNDIPDQIGKNLQSRSISTRCS